MANKNRIGHYSGNRFSLRAKPQDQIKRIDSISNSLGPIGDILVSTWGGIMMGIASLGIYGFLLYNAISKNHFATLIDNIPAIISLLAAAVLVSVNIIMTNPSAGSQFKVSLRFVKTKIFNHSEFNKTLDFRPFRLYEDDDYQGIVESTYKGHTRYSAVYQVRGSVSPVTFADELEDLAMLDRQLITNMERDTLLVTVNAIQTTHVQPLPLPKNATRGMVMRSRQQYQIVKGLKHNQQLKTTIVITSNNPEILRVRTEHAETAFKQGLVIGYVRLFGQKAKQEYLNIYGSLRG